MGETLGAAQVRNAERGAPTIDPRPPMLQPEPKGLATTSCATYAVFRSDGRAGTCPVTTFWSSLTRTPISSITSGP